MMKTISEHKCFDGVQGYYSHASSEIGLEMKFSVFQPPQAQTARVPVLYYLAGLTCSEETFAIKAGAQRIAAQLGLMLVAPDTSPRGAHVPGEADAWDFGVGAGFYVDATSEPWSRHYRMYSYVTAELPALIGAKFPAHAERQGIFGHSMGGHGALVCALRNPEQYKSVSAFAPICAPMRCPWGKKAFKGYLGGDHAAWQEYDASELVKRMPLAHPILVDQGLADKFLADQLYPEVFEAACREAGQPLTLRRQDGYDHGYFFISTFMEDHLRHHAQHLKG
ncbi:MAG TPA: S-formylglutathione hydrolase [Burkholderiales bacterium]